MNPADAQYYNVQEPSRSLMDVEIIVNLIERIGLPAVIIAAAFWYIRYSTDLAKKEREEMWAKDSSNDERLMHLVESTTTVMQEMKAALQSNTETMKELLTEFRLTATRK
jgi:arabinogalactan endo-1,4-beta-galactosidase|tara:strand:- start:682 stop:1011 length:330 start_codon:yes stop_codon:yes gene_type:complete